MSHFYKFCHHLKVHRTVISENGISRSRGHFSETAPLNIDKVKITLFQDKKSFMIKNSFLQKI